MNVERAMQFILERQAETDVRLAEVAALLKQTAARQDKTDRRVEAIAKILQTGMKMLVKFHKEAEERDRVTNQKIEALGKKVDRLVEGWLRGSGNGR